MMTEFRRLLNCTEIENQEIKIRCNQYKNQIEFMNDYQCRAYWRKELLTSPVVGIDTMLGFKGKKLGAMKLKLLNGNWAWFKPCGQGDEMPENEVIASMLDEVLQFHRVAPVVMRNISTALLKNLLKQKYSVFDPKHEILVRTYNFPFFLISSEIFPLSLG